VLWRLVSGVPPTTASAGAREAGILLPLFSLRGARDWGIGEMGQVGSFCRWLAGAGQRLWQLLPLLEMAPGERSPYGALSAFAIDPIYLSLAEVEDFAAAGGEDALDADTRATLAAARADPRIDYDAVRRVKRRALELAFARFLDTEWRTGSVRARALRGFQRRERAWLHDYALFRGCQDDGLSGDWRTWPEPLRDRRADAMARAHRRLRRRCLFHEWVQWTAGMQWDAARREAASAGVRLKGDLPFMVSGTSADVWSRRDEFRLDASVGAPPDAFNAAGQNWGLPVIRWDLMAERDFTWLRQRIARTATLFDALRLDHVLGYFRMFVIPDAGDGDFVPPDETEQRALGRRLLGVILDSAGGMEVIAEDLGLVPEFVRTALTALGVPGYRVLRWEERDGVFLDPSDYPALSVATTGTHDTTTLAAWWEDEVGPDARRALAAVPSFTALSRPTSAFTPAVHAALLDGVYGAGSELVVLPLQDTYGGRERINVPATVDETNWAYRMPWPLETLDRGEPAAIATRLRALAARHAR
jgi:4-alpha-glucanotransferase